MTQECIGLGCDCVLYSGTTSVTVETRTTDLDQQTTVMENVLVTNHRFVAVTKHSASTQVHITLIHNTYCSQ